MTNYGAAADPVPLASGFAHGACRSLGGRPNLVIDRLRHARESRQPPGNGVSAWVGLVFMVMFPRDFRNSPSLVIGVFDPGGGSAGEARPRIPIHDERRRSHGERDRDEPRGALPRARQTALRSSSGVK